jgi:hypothetical protein
VNLEVYANAAGNAQKISDSLDTDDMPRRAPALDPKLKAIVYAWINAGAPETVTPGSGTTPSTIPVPAPAPPTGRSGDETSDNGDHQDRGHGRGADHGGQ